MGALTTPVSGINDKKLLSELTLMSDAGIPKLLQSLVLGLFLLILQDRLLGGVVGGLFVLGRLMFMLLMLMMVVVMLLFRLIFMFLMLIVMIILGLMLMLIFL